jgi:hypothetical protein
MIFPADAPPAARKGAAQKSGVRFPAGPLGMIALGNPSQPNFFP